MIIQGWDWVTVSLLIVAGLIEVGLHGKSRAGKFNGISGIVRQLITFWLLYMGGMFK